MTYIHAPICQYIVKTKYHVFMTLDAEKNIPKKVIISSWQKAELYVEDIYCMHIHKIKSIVENPILASYQMGQLNVKMSALPVPV